MEHRDRFRTTRPSSPTQQGQQSGEEHDVDSSLQYQNNSLLHGGVVDPFEPTPLAPDIEQESSQKRARSVPTIAQPLSVNVESLYDTMITNDLSRVSDHPQLYKATTSVSGDNVNVSVAADATARDFRSDIENRSGRFVDSFGFFESLSYAGSAAPFARQNAPYNHHLSMLPADRPRSEQLSRSILVNQHDQKRQYDALGGSHLQLFSSSTRGEVPQSNPIGSDKKLIWPVATTMLMDDSERTFPHQVQLLSSQIAPLSPTTRAPAFQPAADSDPMTRLNNLMLKSGGTQKLLQEWDKLNGLPKSHSCTMVKTSRSRRQLQLGKILPKWDGSPLICDDAPPVKSRRKKSSVSNTHKKPSSPSSLSQQVARISGVNLAS